MKVVVNAKAHDLTATTLQEALQELDRDNPVIATALNGVFVPRAERAQSKLNEGDCIEILAPMQGG